MEAFLVSAITVAIGEFGDKTQLLAVVLAARFRRPLPIIAGIFCATVVNHLLSAAGGFYLAGMIDGFWFRLAVALAFLAMGAWTLFPSASPVAPETSGTNAFLTTLIGIFVLEVGDKTKIATVALAAKFH